DRDLAVCELLYRLQVIERGYAREAVPNLHQAPDWPFAGGFRQVLFSRESRWLSPPAAGPRRATMFFSESLVKVALIVFSCGCWCLAAIKVFRTILKPSKKIGIFPAGGDRVTNLP